jgi:hypothetical protein
MNNDHDTRTDNSSFVIGQALSGRHLLDSPLDASSYQGAGRFNGADDPHSYSNTPRPLSRPPLRRMDHRGMSERFAAPERPQPQQPQPQPAVIERRTVAAAPPVKHAPAVIENDNDDDDDDINSNGLVSRSGCPRGWLITEAELEKRFARLGASFEDVEVDTEADHRHATPIQPARPAQSASYTSLFDLPRRARSR